MKTTLPFTSRPTSAGTRVIAILGLGVLSAFASPTVKLQLGGEEFGKGIDIDAVTTDNKQLSPSTVYSYKLQGTCTGTGALSKLVPAGTPVASFLNLLKPGSGKSLSGIYDNPTGNLPIEVINKTYSGTQTVPKIGPVTISAKITGGTKADGKVYLTVTNVSIKSSSPTPLGTIKFDKGALFIINTAPEIQFKALGQVVSEGAGTAQVIVTRYANTTGSTSVRYNTVDGSASSLGDKDFTAQSGTVTFAKRETTKLITIPITDNLLKEKTRKFTIQLSNPKAGSILGTKTVTTVSIADND